MRNSKTKNVLLAVLVMLVLALAFLTLQKQKVNQKFSLRIASLEDSISKLNNSIAFVELSNEVLQEINSNLASSIYSKNHSHVEATKSMLSPDAQQVQQLIMNLENGWTAMMVKKDPKLLLKYFMDQYTTNSVKIDTENMPFVQRHNNSDFQTHLNKLVATKDLELQFDKPVFYTTMVRGNIFTTNYLSKLTATHNGQVVHKSTILCFVSGQKKNGQWLIGNYNWTRYDDFDASKNHDELKL